MEISTNLLRQIANYLVTKPYIEVAWLLAELQKETQVKPQEEIKEEETK